ncbi:MAG: type II toxin-antitoxin system VapC family toxin [Candidatus Bathyarchaeia archaeon]
MPASPVCVDASFVVGLLTPEPWSLQALALWERWARAGVPVVAPTLLRYELISALRRKVARGLLAQTDARRALKEGLALGLTFHDAPELSLRAFELAAQFGWAATYDAHYLALAESLGAELWTADERLVRAVGQAFPFVHHVGESGPKARP